jgi:hemoglobin-like flavoprotein
VTDEDFDNVAEALLWTLKKYLGDAYTDEVADAWVVAYTQIAQVMKESSAQARIA